jgi:hypothetical protein
MSWGCYARSLHARPAKDYPPKYLEEEFPDILGLM